MMGGGRHLLVTMIIICRLKLREHALRSPIFIDNSPDWATRPFASSSADNLLLFSILFLLFHVQLPRCSAFPIYRQPACCDPSRLYLSITHEHE